MKNFKKGQSVSWNTSNGKTTGKITKKITHSTSIKGHRAKATMESPQYEVQSSKTGKKAIHKPDQLSNK